MDGIDGGFTGKMSRPISNPTRNIERYPAIRADFGGYRGKRTRLRDFD